MNSKWINVNDSPLCNGDIKQFTIIVDDYFLAEIRVRNTKTKESHAEYYIVRILDDGSLEDQGDNNIGWDFDAVDCYIPLKSLL